MRNMLVVMLALAVHGRAFADGPAGYWEGKATVKDIPLKDKFRTLTRGATVDLWFTVTGGPNHTFVVAGEAEATYDAELEVEKLPAVTVPTPGGSVKFAPEVGGKLSDLDPRRRFRIAGVLTVGSDGSGSLVLEKVDQPGRDAPLHFTIRADPGVSAGLGIDGVGKATVKRGKVGVESNGVAVDAETTSEADSGQVVIEVPMRPFSPFSGPARVAKRPGGPFVATFEDRTRTHSIVWQAKQVRH